MTAVAGFWDLGGAQPAQSCARMLGALEAYGSDGSSQATLGSLTLGRRLFKLLPEDEHDEGVLVGAGGHVLLAADIRIDNRADFVSALGIPAGEASRRSDSALLLSGLERWGEAVLDRLIGDYAFAWFDAREQRLMLARDPLGQRPLFWVRGPNFIAFASMPSGLLALPQLSAGADLGMVARFAALLPQTGDVSFHQQLRRVQPGHLLLVTADRETSRPHWRPREDVLRLGSFGDYVEAYRSTLDQAVASRLRGADGIVASHLSGGWDSSAVTATAARLLAGGKGEVIAFTSVPRPDQAEHAPRGRFADESPLARATAAMYPNIGHRLIRNPARSPIAYLDRTEHLFQRPPFNLCNHDWLSGIRQAASDSGVRVLLTGEIGNWTISSAPNTLLAHFIRERRWTAWAREAHGMLTRRRARLRGVLASSFGPWVPTPLWRATAGLSAAPDLKIPLCPEHLARLQDEIDEQRFGPESRPGNYRRHVAAALSQMDFGQYRKGILAGWGIDKRDATADLRLIEFTLSLPLEMMLNEGERRPLARAALSDRLPAGVLDERGKGYQASDWHLGLTANLPDAYRLIDRIEADARAADLIDTGLLRQWLRDLPTTGWNRPEVISRYRTSLLFALSAGHFIVSNPA